MGKCRFLHTNIVMELFSKTLLSLHCSKGERRCRVPPNFPTRFHPSDVIEFGSDEKVRIKSLHWIIHEFLLFYQAVDGFSFGVGFLH